MASHYDKGDSWFEADAVDLALLGAIGILLVVIVVSLLSMTRWFWWVKVFDMRNWSGWTWCGVGAALVSVLVVMHFWEEIRSWLPW